MGYLRILIICIISIAVVFTQNDTNEEDEPEFSNDGDEYCTMDNNKNGICVDSSMCNSSYHYLPGGDIAEYDEVRTMVCSSKELWCCQLPEVRSTPPVDETKTEPCLAPRSDILPWAVSIYRTKNHSQPSKPYCMGSLIGSRTVLTSATCIINAHLFNLFVRVPKSAQPNTFHKATMRKRHANYSSGSHENDFGFLYLDDDVDWGKEEARGACLDFGSPASGVCVTLGFDANDKITSTIITAVSGPCKHIGGKGVKDQGCGNLQDTYCIAASGAPVVCPAGSKSEGVIFGVVKSACVRDGVLFGNIQEVSTWLNKELNSVNISANVYTLI